MASACSVETITMGFVRRSWSVPSLSDAEVIARKLSVAAHDNPIYPNPFFIVGDDGVSRCKYFAGQREELAA
jgi:hypothetical protein